MPKPVTEAHIEISEGWHQAFNAAGHTTYAERAVAMGVDPSTVVRVQKSGRPSQEVMARAIRALGLTMRDFDRLFRIVDKTQR